MPAQVAELGLDVDALVPHHRWETELDANWKIVCENFLECYHCQVAHPSFSEVIDVSTEAYALDATGRLSSQYGPIRDAGRATMDLEGELPRSQFHFLWPNLTVNIFPGRPNMSIGPVRPLAPERTHRFLDYFFGPDEDEAWIEDLPAEAGIAGLGRSDQVLVNETGTHLFFLAFSGSLNVPPSPVPAGGEATLPLVLNLTQSSDPTAFAAVQNITSYAAAVRGDAWGIPWTVWVQRALPIEGVPPASLSAATYLFDVGRVVISGGTNLGS